MQPGYYSFHSERTTEGAQFTDLIWERQLDGTWSLVHDSFVCGGYCDGESSQWHTTDMGAAQFPAEGLPQHSANHVRLSFFGAHLFPETAHDLEYLRDAPDGWNAARQILYIQNGRWYANGRAGTPEGYHPDLLTFLTDHTGLCGQSHVDCFIATISCVKELTVELWKWSKCDSVVNDLNQITKDLTLLPQFSAYHYMDVTSLLSAKAEEYSGHNGPPLGLWTWWTVFNALPEAAGTFGDSRSVCPETVEFDDNCFVWSDSALTVWKGCEDCGCPDYASHAAATGARSKEWMCLMYRSCSYLWWSMLWYSQPDGLCCKRWRYDRVQEARFPPGFAGSTPKPSRRTPSCIGLRTTNLRHSEPEQT
jgi:hypothetical protein